MLITSSTGTWLEKSVKTSPEDSFIHSVVTYHENGRDKQFNLVYIGYFEEAILETLPYDGDPIFNISGKEVYLRDITALTALIQFPEYRKQKRIYIHDQDQFNHIFTNVHFEKLEEVVTELVTQGQIKLNAATPFLNKTQAG